MSPTNGKKVFDGGTATGDSFDGFLTVEATFDEPSTTDEPAGDDDTDDDYRCPHRAA